MKTTDRGMVALALHEGIVPGPYVDSVGVWTYGVGHTAAAGAPDPAGMARGMPADLDGAIREAMAVFRRDLARYEAEVARAVKVPLAPHEFDALVSFHYNTGAIARAALTRHLNAGDRAAAGAAFMGWLKPASLRGRREAERRLFETGAYPTGSVPVYAVDNDGKIGRVVKRMLPAQVMALIDRPAPPPPRPAPLGETSAPDAPAPRAGLLAAILALLARIFGGSK